MGGDLWVRSRGNMPKMGMWEEEEEEEGGGS